MKTTHFLTVVFLVALALAAGSGAAAGPTVGDAGTEQLVAKQLQKTTGWSTTKVDNGLQDGGCTANALVVTGTEGTAGLQATIDTITELGGCAVHVFPPSALIGFVPPQAAQTLSGMSEIAWMFEGALSDADTAGLPDEAQLAAYIWNQNYVNPTPPERPLPGQPTPAPLVGDALEAPAVQQEGSDQGAGSMSPGFYQTSEFMAYKVAVGIILPESTGALDPSTEDWSESRMNKVVAEIQEGLNWWAGKNPNGHLTFYYDVHIGAPTRYEPINHASWEDGLWIGETLAGLGYPSPGHFNATWAYENALRTAFDADWATAIFVVDSLNDGNGMFTDGWFGYAYLYGPYVVMTYDNDGWGIDRLSSVTAHEIGHIFGAGDEYCQPGYACCWGGRQYGYLGIQNDNCEAGCDHNGNGVCDGNDQSPGSGCQGCPTCVEVSCIMRNNSDDLDIPSAGQVGIRDSDGDGILDTVDTTPVVVLDIWPPDATDDRTPTYIGRAEDIAYDSPTRADVTINTVAVEYQIDNGGQWRPANAADGAFDESLEDFTFTTPSLSYGSHSIVIRAINRSGNASARLQDALIVFDGRENKLNRDRWYFRASTPGVVGVVVDGQISHNVTIGPARACWHQDLDGAAFRGKTVRYETEMRKSAPMNRPGGFVNPYISLQVQRADGSWQYNYGGIGNSTAVAGGPWVGKRIDVVLPTDVKKLRASFCVYDAEPGMADARALTLRLATAPPPPPPPPLGQNLLSANWMWVPQTSAIAGVKEASALAMNVTAGGASGCWVQDLPGAALRGATVRYEASMAKTGLLNRITPKLFVNPYISLQAQTSDGVWHYNHGGVISSRATPGGPYVTESRDIALPADLLALRTSFCVYQAQPGTGRGTDFFLRTVNPVLAQGGEGAYPTWEEYMPGTPSAMEEDRAGVEMPEMGEFPGPLYLPLLRRQ